MSTFQLKDAKNYHLTSEVMVINDQLTSRIIMESIIRSIGDNIKVQSFDNALSALNSAKESTPDLIVVDYKMPGMNGVDFTRKIREIPECTNIPIVVFTIVDDKAVMYEALEAGATDFLTKPIDHYECKVRFRNLLTIRRQQIIIRERANLLETLVDKAKYSNHVTAMDALTLLTRISDIKADYSGYHPLKVGKVSRLIAETLKMNQEFCEIIEISSPLHDIGEFRIPR